MGFWRAVLVVLGYSEVIGRNGEGEFIFLRFIAKGGNWGVVGVKRGFFDVRESSVRKVYIEMSSLFVKTWSGSICV